jgi:hypothetical protein
VKCPNCAASLDLSPDSVIYVCRYCGWSGFVTNEQLEITGVLPSDPGQTEAAVDAFLRRRTGGEYSISERKLIMAPFWLITAHGHTIYNGYRKETRSRTVGSGKDAHTESYTVYRPVRGVIDEDLALTLFARRHERIFAQDKAEEAVRKSSPAKLTQEQLKPLAKSCEFLSSSIGVDEANHWAETRVGDTHRARVEAMCTKVFECYTDASIPSSRLSFYPLYTVRYESRGRTYRLLYDAAKVSVLEAEVPLSRGQRAELLLAGYGLSAVLAGASYELALAISAADTVSDALWVSGAVAAVAFGFTTFLTLMATRSQRKVEAK